MQTDSSASAHVLRVAVGLGMDDDGLDAELAARALDAQRDLAAIGDQDLVEQLVGAAAPPCGLLLDHEQRLAELDRLAVFDEDRLDMPAVSASISFISFIASMMHSVSPCCDRVADLDERLRAGRCGAIERADHRALHRVAFGRRRAAAAVGADRRPARGHAAGAAGAGRGTAVAGRGGDGARDAHPLLAFLDLEFGDARKSRPARSAS